MLTFAAHNHHDMRNVPDREILHALGGENPAEGMRMLFDKYYAPLVVHAAHLLHDNARAEDVVQEFYVRLWNDDRLRRAPVRALSSYLHAGVRNACHTLRARKDTLHRPLPLDGVEIPVEAFVDITDDRVERVKEEIERLPERTRRVVRRVMLDELSYKEVAGELGISINTVKYLLKEGMRRLRDKFSSGTRQLLLLFRREK
jgi:RNA polymerase sigma-70 factor (ECF subfamily)